MCSQHFFSQICWLKGISSMQFHSSADSSSQIESHTPQHTAAVLIAMPTEKPTHVNILEWTHTETGEWPVFVDMVGLSVCISGWDLQTARQTKVTSFPWTSSHTCTSYPNNPANHKQACCGCYRDKSDSMWRCVFILELTVCRVTLQGCGCVCVRDLMCVLCVLKQMV